MSSRRSQDLALVYFKSRCTAEEGAPEVGVLEATRGVSDAALVDVAPRVFRLAYRLGRVLVVWSETAAAVREEEDEEDGMEGEDTPESSILFGGVSLASVLPSDLRRPNMVLVPNKGMPMEVFAGDTGVIIVEAVVVLDTNVGAALEGNDVDSGVEMRCCCCGVNGLKGRELSING